MGEISFNYSINTEPIHEAAFKYWFSKSSKYGFTYQRYIAFSDTSIFNSPVVITKVATGLYQLYDLFLDKKAYPVSYVNFIKNFDKVYDAQEDEENMLFDKSHEDVNKNKNLYRISTPYSFYLNRYLNQTQLFKNDPYLNKYGIPILNRSDLILNISDDINLSMDDNILNIRQKEYWMLKEYFLEIYKSPIIEKLYDNELAIYSSKYNNLERTRHLKILDETRMGTPFDNHLNIYKAFLTTPFDIELNILDIALTKPFNENKTLDAINNIFLEPIRDIYANALDIYFGKTYDLNLNTIPQTWLEYPILHANIAESAISKLSDVIGNINSSNISCSINNKSLDVNNKILSGITSFTDIDVVNKILLGIKYFRNAASQHSFFVERNIIKTSNRFNNILPIFKGFTSVDKVNIETVISNSKRILFEQQYSIHIYDKPLCYFDLDTFSILNPSYCITIKDTTVTMEPKDVSTYNNIYQCFKGNKNTFIQNFLYINADSKKIMTSTGVYGIKQRIELNIDNTKIFSFKDNKMLQLNSFVSVNLSGKEICIFDIGSFVDKYIVESSISKKVFVYRKNKGLELDITAKWLDKNSHELVFNHSMQGFRKSKDFTIQDNGIFIFKDRKKMNPDNMKFLPVFKNNRNTQYQYELSKAFKSSHSSLNNIDVSCFRKSYLLDLYQDSWFTKNYHDALLYKQLFIDRENYYASVFQRNQSFIKSIIPTYIPSVDSVIKNYIPTSYAKYLHNSFAGMIIPISKVRHQGYIDNINLMVQKIVNNGYINQEMTTSVIPRNVYTQSIDLFCDKKEFKTYIDYKNNQITKAQIHSVIFKDKFIKKEYISSNVVKTLIWTEKELTTQIDKQVKIYKKTNEAYIENIFNITTDLKDIYHYDSLFVDKTNQICYYDYGITWIDKTLKAQIDSQLSIDIEQQKAHVLNCVSPFIKEQIQGFYNYGVFTNENIQKSDLFKQLNDVHKLVYDTDIPPNDFGNWAWIYETPDPFEDFNFGIDELLLPETDTRYKDFEEIIFDKQNMRPRNPVKQIDDNTFIAKFPSKHPLPKYSDIGIDYDSSAIKLENFYGIEASIMRTVFLKFYRIWQTKIFEFGTMTMVQSVKLMLDYMYSWIMSYFPLEEIEQALRVFRLIRWYGESSIIQNSQYIVSYEYDTLESKLNTGTCLVPNDLNQQNTMYVDSNLGVIANNPIYVNDQITNAYVTFYIDNKKNTTFTFSLSNTVGSVNIYINEVLVDTVSKSALNLTYQLPYTGDTNIIKIEKPATHNLNNTFYIGNIKIPNCTFKDLSIEFDPTLKAGNKPLNDVAKKMIAFANLHEDREEYYEIIRKGNLGVGEIYKKLSEYWELHHQNKIKGKRLTIKEV